MTADSIRDRVAAIARQMMEVARSNINVAVGNTLVVSVPLNDIDMSDDMTALVRSVAESTGFNASYSETRGLQFSWTNAGVARVRTPETTLADINNVLGKILALQAEAAQHRNDWSRQDVLQAISILVAILFGVIAVIMSSANSSPISGGGNDGSGSVVQTHQERAPSQPEIPQSPAPSPNESP